MLEGVHVDFTHLPKDGVLKCTAHIYPSSTQPRQLQECSLLYLHRILFDYDTTKFHLVHRNKNHFDFRPGNITFEPGGTHKLKRPERRNIILHGCELRPSFDGSRCAPAWRCPHYKNCMNEIADETEGIGWEAEGENCKTYHRSSGIRRERAIQIMGRLWKAFFDKQLTAGATAAGTIS